MEKSVSVRGQRPGFCSFGLTESCCYGWRNVSGECQVCKKPCVNGICTGPERCSCYKGYKGKQCNEEPDCSGLRCQVGCQIGRNGALTCLCPPGLKLAKDNRTCEIDECEGPFPVCSESQACRNTFGSFVCVCRLGYVLGTIGNSITCR
uniref:Si:ch211-194g2.4 n=1 Tax=Astyanax mexicanus TaxID=7994 RepID=A0A3B1IKZ1_ASTMX